jgi:hypothetical protein
VLFQDAPDHHLDFGAGALLLRSIHAERLAQHLDQLVGDKSQVFVAHDLHGALIVGQGTVKSQ